MAGMRRLHRPFARPLTGARSHVSLVVVAVTAALSLTAASSVATETGVTIVFRAYQPSTTIVTVGQTVTWQNSTLMQHTVTAIDGTFNSGVMAGGTSFSVTFTTPGTFLYKCLVHPTMKGTVIVRSAQEAQIVQVRLAKQRRHTLVHVQASRPGAKVLLQARKGPNWQDVAQARLSALGTATLSVSSTIDRRLRVVVLGEPGETPLTKVLQPGA
jgi:plastocyanin